MPYFYTVRGRSSKTGAKSNPSPITRYGVSPRRQSVTISMVDTVVDSQMDKWDIFRYGGGVTSWRYIGSVTNSGGSTDTFIDDFTDDSALGGSEIEYDNLQPWPTIYIPFLPIEGTVSGVTTDLRLSGSALILVYSSANPFSEPFPYLTRLLPGNVALINNQFAYTLRTRPTALTLSSPPAANYYAYLFEFVENAGSTNPFNMLIQETNIAAEPLPYLFGPDAYGTVFGVGDKFRPGNLYYSKAYNPDSAPSDYNIEISIPEEPLVGGVIVAGRAFVASSDRWWGLNPTFGNPLQRYQPVDIPVGRGAVAPSMCTDGIRIFFVAKDGIWMHSGGPGVSLTEADLSNLFPQEGSKIQPSNYSYAGYTIPAPDYAYASLFRLSCNNSFLYFDYRDSTGTARTLVCDYRDPENPAWSYDAYADAITVHFGLAQPAGPLLSTATRYDLMVMGDNAGKIYTQEHNKNDGATAISPAIATFEYNGGDVRKVCLFDDIFLDFVPVSGLQAAPVSAGATVAAYKSFTASSARVRSNVPASQELPYLGVIVKWTDNFSTQSAPTTLVSFQPRYQGTPISVFQWTTQFTAFGMQTYGHIRYLNFAYKSTDTVTLTITAYDGTSPAVIQLPTTGGVVKKVMVPVTYNKGLLYKFSGVSVALWQPYLSESEIFVGEWGRTGPYQIFRDIEAASGITS